MRGRRRRALGLEGRDRGSGSWTRKDRWLGEEGRGIGRDS